eukprot:TRINITY_DN2778_c0_g1_i2.p1 TRINITY_DN2778_c0_g1~~TRINITY_DN2778_c0_g1_i2.p1  ORF type:complete len:409 (-),score=70.36 TRINITY_DN2778_c0_g1_i2:998-2224(-)
MRNGIVLVDVCFGEESYSLLMIVMFATSTGAAVWLIGASLLKFPVSTTHSSIGAMMGATIAVRGFGCINWGLDGLSKIFISWITSPLISGIVGIVLYGGVYASIFKSKKPLKALKTVIPFMVGLCVLTVSLMVLFDEFFTELLEWYIIAFIAFGASVLFAVLTAVFYIPCIMKRSKGYDLDTLKEKLYGKKEVQIVPVEDDNRPFDTVDDKLISYSHVKKYTIVNEAPDTSLDMELAQSEYVFKYLQIFTASIASFAHGANDTANSIGPFIVIYYLMKEGNPASDSPPPIWLVAIGALCMIVGFALFGYKVIETIGKKLTEVHYSSGFSIELSSALTVVLASKFQIPVSSTHCQVGSVVGAGIVKGKNNVSWKLFGKIVLAWVVTLPISGLIAAITAIVLNEIIAEQN